MHRFYRESDEKKGSGGRCGWFKIRLLLDISVCDNHNFVWNKVKWLDESGQLWNEKINNEPDAQNSKQTTADTDMNGCIKMTYKK